MQVRYIGKLGSRETDTDNEGGEGGRDGQRKSRGGIQKMVVIEGVRRKEIECAKAWELLQEGRNQA